MATPFSHDLVSISLMWNWWEEEEEEEGWEVRYKVKVDTSSLSGTKDSS